MDDPTARALNRINRAFYRAHAESFSATREQAWPGWLRLWQELEAQGWPGARPEVPVCDVGCGNGRWGRFLAERVPGLRYLGLDASPQLLALARRSGGLGAAPELRLHDLVEQPLAEALGARRFAGVALFGVLHHVPGAARRRTLLAELLARLEPDGLLVLTGWQLALFERFRARALDGSEWSRAAQQPIDPAQLEPGDRLLPWGDGEGVRYVHFAGEQELPQLLEELPCRTLASFCADGREDNLNRYFVLRAGA